MLRGHHSNFSQVVWMPTLVVGPCRIIDAELMLMEGYNTADVRLYFSLLACSRLSSDCRCNRANNASSAKGGEGTCTMHHVHSLSDTIRRQLVGLRHVKAQERLITSWGNWCQLPLLVEWLVWGSNIIKYSA